MPTSSARVVAGLAGEIFEAYPEPTLIVDRDLRLVMANRAARAMLDEESRAIPLLGSRAGDLFRCASSGGRNGCGREAECAACVIRESVHHALTTGTVHRSRADLRVSRHGEDVDVCVLVSASPVEQEGDKRVVLTVEDVSDLIRLKDEVTRAERSSQESEALYCSLFELAPSGVVLLDEDGRILQFNEQAHRQLGYAREEFADLHVSDVDADEVELHVRAHIARIFERGGAEFDARHRARSGEIRQMLVRARPVEIRGQRRVLCVLQDITERKRVEEALRMERDLNKSVTENAGESIFVTDEHGRITFVNREAERVFGFASHELDGRMFHDAVHHHHPDGRLYLLSDCPHRGIVRDGLSMRRREDVFFRKDGSPVNVLCSGAPLERDGKRMGSVFIVSDTTELTAAEEARRHGERRFRALIERSTDVIFVLDEEARLTFWSPSATEVLGWTAEEVVGRSWYDLAHSDDVPSLAAAWAAVVPRDGAASRTTARMRHHDGSWRLIESAGRNLLNDPAVQGVVVNSRDVTDQRRLEEQFQQAQKLESIGRLASGIAHDFNNLLTVILSGTEELRRERREGATPDAAIVDDIAAAGARARELTRQLLAFARRQVIAPVPLDLNGLVRDGDKLLRRLLGEDVELVTALDPALWPVRCDPGQMEQVVLNLAVNARDAMPRGGTLRIETANFLARAGDGALFPGVQPGPYVRMAVQDCGAGMSPEVKKHLFEPFFTTKPVGKGTGLGLAMVYGIVDQSGGFIRVESEPGHGTRFEILLPRCPDPVAPAERPVGVTTERGTETVLVVEDDPQVRAVAIRALQAGGYLALAAGDAREALEVARREEGPLHLLVADVVVPGADVRDLGSELRRRHPAMRVLYVSGHAEESIATRGVLAPGIKLLPKPFTASSLLASVRAVLDAP